MAEVQFDISKYITAADVASAITAGVIAYIKNRPKVDDQQRPDASQATQQAAATPKGPTWGSQEWRDDMIRQGKMVERDGIYFHVNKSGQPLEAYKFFKGGSYAKMPIADVDDALVNGPEDWWDFDKANAVLVSPNGATEPLDPDFLGRLEGVLDKNFGGKDAMNSIGAEVRQAAAAASGLDPELAAAKGLHDGTGKAFAAATTPTVRPAVAPAKVTLGTTPTGGTTMTTDRRYLLDIMAKQGEKYSTPAAQAARAARVAARGGMPRIGTSVYES